MILQNTSDIKTTAKKIISLVPSQTELLWYLGLEDEVIGITKFCVHPEDWFKNKKRIGGTKQLHIDDIIKMQPDLIIANREENDKAQVELLASHCNVWVTDVNNLEDAMIMITNIGQLCGKETEAIKLAKDIELKFSKLCDVKNKQPEKAVYLIWENPYMTVGGDTFINDMMKKAGYENVFATERRYPELTIENIKNPGCTTLLLSTEPYPFTAKHISKFQAEIPGITVKIVDGEMFSWYGSRLLQAPQYFAELV